MIEVSDLTKVFGQTVAVDHLTFSVQSGSVTGFLGPNGAGKSTTMRMILGLDNPNSGSATIDGQVYQHIHRPLTKVGALLDANWVHPSRSARSHLLWMAAASGIPARRVDEVLDLVGLKTVAKKAVGKFSLGMKQRLGLAGAILGDPPVLLFDEPVNGLDPEGILWIRTFMKNLAAAGRTVFVSSHLLSEMAQTADHLIVIGKGRLIADAPTEEFISRATEKSVRVRSPQLEKFAAFLADRQVAATDGDGFLSIADQPIERVGELAAEAGITLHELAGVTGSLEQAFMQLTGDAVEYTGGQGFPGPEPLAAAFGPPGGPPAGPAGVPFNQRPAAGPGGVGS